MKKYALMIVVSSLFCMFQMQSSERDLRPFKIKITQEVARSAGIFEDAGLNYEDIENIARLGKNEAIAKGIPSNKAASIVINTLAQRAFNDLENFRAATEDRKQSVLESITEAVNDVFGSN